MGPSIHRGPRPGRIPRHCERDSLGQIRKIRVCWSNVWDSQLSRELRGVNMYLVNNAGTPLVGPLIDLIKINRVMFDIILLK